jgi:hypothetical protein
MPPAGVVVADINALKRYVGTRTDTDDVILAERLFAAQEYVYERVYDHHRTHPDVQEAILLMASRLYKRRQTPEGVAGFGGEGAVVRVVAADYDVASLLELHINYDEVGLA